MLDSRKLTAALVLAMSLGALGACSSDDEEPSDGGGPDPATFPTDTSAQGIAAFLDAETYKSAPWTTPDTEPRPPASSSPDVPSTSPHKNVRVYRNPQVQASFEAGDGTLDGTSGEPLDQYSMIVKEMFDESGTLLGKAVNLKVTEGERWTFFCYASVGATCGTDTPANTEDDPYYGVGVDAGGGCSACHGDGILSPPYR